MIKRRGVLENASKEVRLRGSINITAENPTTLEKLQQMLGHQDFQTTLQYAHLTSRSVANEVNKLN